MDDTLHPFHPNVIMKMIDEGTYEPEYQPLIPINTGFQIGEVTPIAQVLGYPRGSGKTITRGFGASSLWMSDPWSIEPEYPIMPKTFTTLVNEDENAPAYAKIMAPLLTMAKVSSYLGDDEAFLKLKANKTNFQMTSDTKHGRWIAEMERDAARYILQLMERKKRLRALYRLFNSID